MDKTYIYIYEHRLIQKVLTYTHLWGKMNAQASFHIQRVSKSDFVEGSKDDVLSPTPWHTVGYTYQLCTRSFIKSGCVFS